MEHLPGSEQEPELALVAQGWAQTSYGPLGLRSLEPEHGLRGAADPIKPMTGRLPGVMGQRSSPSPTPCQLQEPSLYTIKAVFILDNDGHRLLAKVTSHPHQRVPENCATVPRTEVPNQLTSVLGETPLWAL